VILIKFATMRSLKDQKKVRMYQDGGFLGNVLGDVSGGDLLNVGMSIYSGIRAGKQAKEQKDYYQGLAASEADKYKQAEGLYNRTLQDLMNTEKYGKEEFEMGPEAAEARDAVNRAAEMMVDNAREKGEQDTASILNVLDGGDPAQAALAISQLDDISGGVSEAEQKAAMMSNQANQAYGAEASRIRENNVGVRNDNRARLAALAGLEMQRGAAGMDDTRQIQAEMTAAGIDPAMEGLATGMSTYQSFAEDGLKVPDDFQFVGREGGMSSSTTDGRKFSHDENPIHMIDKDGEKVGEMTGGEYILNPKHSGDIKKLVEKGDAYGLLDYLDNLLSQPRFQ